MFKRDFNIILIALAPIFFYIGVRWLALNNTHCICLFKLITGHECWGCGMTRAFNALFELDFQKAYNLNPRVIIVAPLLIYIWGKTLLNNVGTKRIKMLIEKIRIAK